MNPSKGNGATADNSHPAKTHAEHTNSIAIALDSQTASTCANLYAAQGWQVLAIRPNGKRPVASGWQSAPLAQVFADIAATPNANIGIAVPAGFMVLDVDIKTGGPATLQKLEAQHGKLPDTLTANTPTGGRHMWFKLPAGVTVGNRVAIAPGLDVRADGGYVVAAPSTIDGKAYTWTSWDCCSSPSIADAPAWLTALARQPIAKLTRGDGDSSPIPEGQRNHTLFHNSAALWHQGVSQATIETAIADINEQRCDPPLDAGEVASILASACKRDPVTAPWQVFAVPGVQPAGLEPLLKPVSVVDVITNPAPPPGFVWDGYLPRGNVTLMGAHGGTGKSTIALMLAVCAALGRPLFGVDTQACKVLFASLEDGAGVVRHRLAAICKAWLIDPELLRDRLHIVDGTEHPELFAAETRGAGLTTASYYELCRLVQRENVGLVLVDNASDAFGGDEIQRRQVRAFMRALNQVARLTDCAVMLLAHVDKATSRARKAEGGEAYSGSTAWHNSARSRIFLTRGDDGLLTLEHQKSNLGRKREPITLNWFEGGFPQLVDGGGSRQQGRADDDRAVALLRLMAEFSDRGQYCSPVATARNSVHAMLRSEPDFQKLKLSGDDTKRIVNQCQRAGWIASTTYRKLDRKQGERWTVTGEGRAFAASAACSRFVLETAQTAEHAASAACSRGVWGESAHTDTGEQKTQSGVVP